jgi:hypothetical protein
LKVVLNGWRGLRSIPAEVRACDVCDGRSL